MEKYIIISEEGDVVGEHSEFMDAAQAALKLRDQTGLEHEIYCLEWTTTEEVEEEETHQAA